MKSHDLSKALRKLAEVLASGPNVKLEDLMTSDREHGGPSDIAVNLTTLATLSRIDKQQWLNFIQAYDLPIATRPRDASRDILGKLLSYLDRTPEARRKLEKTAQAASSQTSPELQKALKALLRD